MNKLIKINNADKVAVALHPIAKGESIQLDSQPVTARANIPQGHKIALQVIHPGELVIKYGFPIGRASAEILPGDWVHVHNMVTNLNEDAGYTCQLHPVWPEPEPPLTFSGYRRTDGRAAIRNELWILPTVGCVNGVAERLARQNQQLVSGSVEGLYAFPHPFGCSQMGDDHAQTRRLLAALARHPNAGGVLVLSLGCENLTREQFLEELGPYDPNRIKFLTCQEVEDELEAGSALLRQLADYAGSCRRESIPVSELVVGMKCGGSDGLSGITANPAVGLFSDRFIAQGGSTILTEVPEMFGAEQILLDRCVSREVYDRAVRMVTGFKDYYRRHGQVVYENPSPGNKAGGITTLEDKSCGCVQKGGSAPVTDVLQYGEAVRQKGLTLLSGPGNDLVSATALTAAGAHLILFTTGRGTPFGAPAPTLKIATNSPLAQKKRGWMDFDAGPAADGEPLTETADRLMRKVLAVASGEQTQSERQGYREISIFKDGVVL